MKFSTSIAEKIYDNLITETLKLENSLRDDIKSQDLKFMDRFMAYISVCDFVLRSRSLAMMTASQIDNQTISFSAGNSDSFGDA